LPRAQELAVSLISKLRAGGGDDELRRVIELKRRLQHYPAAFSNQVKPHPTLASRKFDTLTALMEFPSKTEILLVGAGALLGAGLVQAIHSLRVRPPKTNFEARLCCRNLAAAYAKNSRDNGETVIERIDFSPGRSSCLASTLTLAGKHHEVEKFGVVDVVSEERIFEASCNSADPKSKVFCGNGMDATIRKQRDAAFQNALESEKTAAGPVR
jgi:hypothetical protein